MDWSRLKANRLTMSILHARRRIAAWVRVEPRTDAWASYAALGLAALVTLAALAL